MLVAGGGSCGLDAFHHCGDVRVAEAGDDNAEGSAGACDEAAGRGAGCVIHVSGDGFDTLAGGNLTLVDPASARLTVEGATPAFWAMSLIEGRLCIRL